MCVQLLVCAIQTNYRHALIKEIKKFKKYPHKNHKDSLLLVCVGEPRACWLGSGMRVSVFDINAGYKHTRL